jgi:hypothetical protein
LRDLGVVRIQQQLQRLTIDSPLGVLEAQDALEWAGDVLAIDQPDLVNQAVEPEPHGGVANAVLAGELLEGSRRQHEPFYERDVLVFERIYPSGSGLCDAELRPVCFHFTNMYFNNILHKNQVIIDFM